eukprot:GILK01009413.1.p1 GENE.GILK01009413.1~~GILK01009413.1.p1  ORF type:complete len:330 (+),score=30.44 GILK01009413.1:42-992(+)
MGYVSRVNKAFFSLARSSVFKPSLRELEYKVLPPYSVPSHITEPFYVRQPEKLTAMSNGPPKPLVAEDQRKLKRACQLAAKTLQVGLKTAKVGVTTDAIDKAVHEFIVENNAYPTPLGFWGFPKSVCTSVNEVVCHGIPDTRPLKDGDIVNVDVTVYLDGFHGDCSGMAMVGDVKPEDVELVETTKEALRTAIAICEPFRPIRDIGSTITSFAEAHGFQVSPHFSGHGIGRHLHEPPYVHAIPNNSPHVMQPGIAFTIEPILMRGDTQIKQWSDGWTIVSADSGRSAQWEHTILITDNGHEILTKLSEEDKVVSRS